jgi:hypothetical protein
MTEAKIVGSRYDTKPYQEIVHPAPSPASLQSPLVEYTVQAILADHPKNRFHHHQIKGIYTRMYSSFIYGIGPLDQIVFSSGLHGRATPGPRISIEERSEIFQSITRRQTAAAFSEYDKSEYERFQEDRLGRESRIVVLVPHSTSCPVLSYTPASADAAIVPDTA